MQSRGRSSLSKIRREVNNPIILNKWTTVHIFIILLIKVNTNNFKKGDSIPVFLGDNEETYLFVLSANGSAYEVQIKRRFKHEKKFRYEKIFILEDTDIEEFRLHDPRRTDLQNN